MRAFIYFELIDALRNGMPIDDDIEKELTYTLFEFTNNSKIKLISKDDIKLVLKHSPDKTDSLALTFVNGYDYKEVLDTNDEFSYINPED